MSEQSSKGSLLIKAMLLGSVALVVLAGGAFYFAAQKKPLASNDTVTRVNVNTSSCDPMDLSLAAGKHVFEIHNTSDRPIEWEILDGVMVVEERENIAPGFHSRLTATLRPGIYDITCGLLTNARGKLTVTASTAFDEAQKTVPITAFIGPLSELKVLLTMEVNSLLGKVESLNVAVKSGNLAEAKAAWHAAREPYKRIEAFTDSFSDLENAIDALPDYFEQREKDPNFSGFHRIEYSLWQIGSLADVEPVTLKLVADVETLKARLKTTRFTPNQITANLVRLVGTLEQAAKTEQDNRWAGPSTDEFAISIAAVEKVAGLLAPIARDKAPEALKAQQIAIDDVKQLLARQPTVPSQDLGQKLGALSTALAQLQTALGLE